MQKLGHVLQRLEEAKLKIKLSKCSFLKKIKFLGHEVSENGMAIRKDHFQPLRDFPTPTKKKMYSKVP